MALQRIDPCQRRRVQGRLAAVGPADDVVGGFRPDEGIGISIVIFDAIADGSFRLGDAFANTAANTVGGDLPDPAPGQIQP